MVSVTKDVEIDPNTVADGDILQYDAAQQVWTNVTRSGLGIVLTDLDDIGITANTLTNGQVLKYNATAGTWENVDPSTLSIALDNLSNVTVPSPTSGDFLKWNGTAWVNDAIDLGTDTTGNYVSDVTSGTGITVTHTPSEGSSASVALNAALDDLSDTAITSAAEFQVLEFNGTSWINKYASVAAEVRNVDTVTLATGTAVYLFGANGDKATVKRADNDSDATSSKVIGLVGAPIAQNESGPVITRGYVDGINLSSGYSPGDILYLGEDGGFTKVKPVAPEHTVFLGVVCRANANGIVYVATQNGYELDELHNVKITTGTLDTGDVLAYNGTTGVWENTEVSSLGITLGTDTTGNYVSEVSAGTGISVSHTPSEGSTATVSLSASLDNLSDVAVTSAAIGNTLVYTGSNFVNRNAFVANSYQTAVDERKVTQVGSFQTAVPATNVGSATFVVFRNACEITELSIYLNATHTGATTYDYRLGIYNDDNGKPGSLLVDAGTVSIANGATAGFKTITLGTAQSVSAGQVIWLVCAATHSGAVPTLINHAGHIQPYSDYGLTASTHYQACCFAYTTGPATALPATFTLAATETQPVGVAVYAKVNIP
jgi:hypothetical protein